jgi:hypothetical protein
LFLKYIQIFCHTKSSKGKRKQGESLSSSQARSDMSVGLFTVIVLFHFIYTSLFIFTVLFYLIYFTLIFIYRALWPLDSDMNNFLGCCMTRSSRRPEQPRWRLPTAQSHGCPHGHYIRQLTDKLAMSPRCGCHARSSLRSWHRRR